MKYFIQRYISDATLRLELKFIHQCFEQITNRKIECVVIDTIGVDARIKSVLYTHHNRYNTVEVIDETKEICGNDVRIYTGDGHTTTKISAGMAFLSHGVIAGGRLHY